MARLTTHLLLSTSSLVRKENPQPLQRLHLNIRRTRTRLAKIWSLGEELQHQLSTSFSRLVQTIILDRRQLNLPQECHTHSPTGLKIYHRHDLNLIDLTRRANHNSQDLSLVVVNHCHPKNLDDRRRSLDVLIDQVRLVCRPVPLGIHHLAAGVGRERQTKISATIMEVDPMIVNLQDHLTTLACRIEMGHMVRREETDEKLVLQVDLVMVEGIKMVRLPCHPRHSKITVGTDVLTATVQPIQHRGLLRKVHLLLASQYLFLSTLSAVH